MKGGVNFTNYQGNTDNLTASVGFHGGMYLSARFSHRFGLQPEILYSSHKMQDLLTPGSHISYGYLIFPVTAKIFLTRFLNLQVIPQIGKLVNAKLRIIATPPLNGKFLFKSADFSIGGGLGMESATGLNVSLRYFYGCTDTFKPILELGKTTKNTLQVSVAYTFL